MGTITKTEIKRETERLDFLPRKAGKHFLEFENCVYDWMGQLCEKYKGGLWDFYELSNGGFFMAYRHAEALRVEFPNNYFAEDMSAEAASIAANLFALNGLCWKYSSESLTDAFYALRDYAAQHPEGAYIMRVID